MFCLAARVCELRFCDLVCVVATFGQPMSAPSRVHLKTDEVSSSDGHEPEGTPSREALDPGDVQYKSRLSS